MSTPSTAIEPPFTTRRRRIIFPIVVLPLPLSPMSETTSPAPMSNETSRTARSSVPPNRPTR